MTTQNSGIRERVDKILSSMFKTLREGYSVYTPEWDEDKQWLCLELKNELNRSDQAIAKLEKAEADLLKWQAHYKKMVEQNLEFVKFMEKLNEVK